MMSTAIGTRIFLLCLSFLMGKASIGGAEGFPAIQVYEKEAKSVVLIVARGEGKQGLVGAGSVIEGSGFILTCAHVVIDKDTSRPMPDIQVIVKPDKVTGDMRRDIKERYKGRVEAYDLTLDLATVKVESAVLPAGVIPLADPDDIRIGEEVIAVGHPEQGGLWTLTYGRISGAIDNQTGVPGKDVYQTDTSVNRGNSGGPLLDRRGYLVGVNSSVARVGAGNLPITGVNFAIKSSVAKRWLEKNGHRITYGTIPLRGIAPSRASDESMGVRATSQPIVVPEGGPPTYPPDQGVYGSNVFNVKGRGDSNGIEQTQPPENKILTPNRPYKTEEFLAEVEREMNNLMEEMKEKVRRRKGGGEH